VLLRVVTPGGPSSSERMSSKLMSGSCGGTRGASAGAADETAFNVWNWRLPHRAPKKQPQPQSASAAGMLWHNGANCGPEGLGLTLYCSARAGASCWAQVWAAAARMSLHICDRV
jgi:hypothetical protein